jgi:hypothetical protein
MRVRPLISGIAITLGLLRAAGAAWLPPRVRPKAPPPVPPPIVVRLNGESWAHRVMSAFVLPNEPLEIAVVAPKRALSYEIEAKTGELEHLGPGRARWTSAKPALHEIDIRDPRGGDRIEIHAFVMVPFAAVQNELLHGYRIGRYPPDRPPPPGFVEVTASNQDRHLTPNFRIKQFVTKQKSDFPKYVVLRPRLLLKLESVLAEVKDAGYKCDTLHVMSGYRTPFYNEAIENVTLSQHVWGSAADVFVDADEDGNMDDLDRNGRIDRDDAEVLLAIVDRMDRAAQLRFPGGLGLYGGTRTHGPFVHIDVRGRLARW